MKEFKVPEINISKIEVEDVITTSTWQKPDGTGDDEL